MQRGVLWGIGRLCQTRPFLVRKDAGVLMGYLGAPDAGVRGTAAWVMGLLRAEEARAGLENLLDDGADLQLYVNETLVRRRVKELAREALERLPPGVQ
jgi:HEAT repeat protein